MLIATTIAGIISILAWLYLLFARGGFWRVKNNLSFVRSRGHLHPATRNTGARRGPRGLRSPGAETSFRVAVIIPARNEAGVVGQSIASLFNQVGGHEILIFLVDDASTDGTTEAARQAAAQVDRAADLTIIQARPLPAGWTGKLWALQQGIEAAQLFVPQYFLFTDADILHAPDNIATLVAIAENGSYDLASFMVKLHCATLAEKLLIPAFVFFFFKLYPTLWIRDSRRKAAGAAGGSILVRPEALARAGGIAAIRNQIIDDCALARVVKQHGGKLWLGLSPATTSLRSYNTFREIGRMISRTAFNQLNHSLWLLLAALIGLTILYLLPPLLLLSRHPLPMILGGLGWLMMSLAYLPMIRFYRLNPLWAVSLPLTTLFYLGATLYSAFRFWSGHGGEWKGRIQDR